MTTNGTALAPAQPQPETEEQKKLRELRAQRKALVAAREAAQIERAAARAIEVEERAIRDEVALAEAIEKYGEIGTHIETVETSMGLVILKRASAMKFRRFQDKGDATSEDVAALVRPCIVWPSAAEVDVMLDELPAALVRMASAVISLAGQRSGELAKK